MSNSAALAKYHQELNRVRSAHQTAPATKNSWLAREKNINRGTRILPGLVVRIEYEPLRVPAFIENMSRFALDFAEAWAETMKYRIGVLGINSRMEVEDTHNNTGGMWRGLTAIGKKNGARIEFRKGSYSSAFGRKAKKIKASEDMIRKAAKSLRREIDPKTGKSKNPRVRNRHKAQTVQHHKKTQLLAPTPLELNAMAKFFDAGFLKIVGGKW